MCTSMSVLYRANFNRTCSSSIRLFARKHILRLGENRRYFHSSVDNCVQNNASATLFNQKRFGSSARVASTNTLPGFATKKEAKEYVLKMSPEQRQMMFSALEECQSQKLKAEYEGQLAAFYWRNKFGRSTKAPSLGDVDPTGSFCAVPDDWLLRKYAETVPQPTRAELIRVAVHCGIPFVGFGFLDNAIMIIAGDSIELFVGRLITISTLTAAALGNTVSDIMGIGSASYVEHLALKIGFETPKLTPIQLNLPCSRISANAGRIIGITIGCVLGMIPLLFLKKEPKEKNDETSEKIEDEKVEDTKKEDKKVEDTKKEDEKVEDTKKGNKKEV